MKTIRKNIQFLCDESMMLTGLSASYGTDKAHETVRYGRAKETVLQEDGSFVPDAKPLEADTLYDLASLTKLFTSVITMQLVSDGKLSLEETVGQIDPRFIHLKNVSVFDVLSFRAHIRTPGRIDEASDRDQALERLFAAAPAESPRIRLYSDINAMIMKYVVEQKTGLPFNGTLQQYILSPAGMGRTYAVLPETEKQHCVCYNYEHRIESERYVLRTDTPEGAVHDPKAAILSQGGRDLCGHAGLFSCSADMIRFAQALLSGELLSKRMLDQIGTNRTGFPYPDGAHRQYLGFLCFVRHPNQVLSEVPAWMSDHAFGLSGFTGNHFAIDPQKKSFTLFLGNRCHGRVSHITPPAGGNLRDYGLAENGIGVIPWTDGRKVPSSAKYVYFKDEYLNEPIRRRMCELGWL